MRSISPRNCSRRVRFFFNAYSALAKLRWLMPPCCRRSVDRASRSPRINQHFPKRGEHLRKSVTEFAASNDVLIRTLLRTSPALRCKSNVQVDHSHTPCRSNVGNLAPSRATAPVKACVTPALPRRRSRYPSASGQVLRKPRGRKPRRTPRWSLSAASMAIEWRWGCDPAACGASSRPRRRTRFACDAPLRRGSERQRNVRVRSPRNARSDTPDATVGVELVGGDRTSS